MRVKEDCFADASYTSDRLLVCACVCVSVCVCERERHAAVGTFIRDVKASEC